MKIQVKQSSSLIAAIVFIAMYASQAAATEQSEPLLNFKFNHLSNGVKGNNQTIQSREIISNTMVNFAQYDATWTYPWETKNMNIDLGVTLRHLSGFQKSTENKGNSYFQRVLPLLHASALYSLPLKGLSAGIEGSHLGTSGNQIFDYRAKISYQWREGFGLQGGWQHQQFNLDNSVGGADYRSTGPFLDFYLNF